jgi:hypothetical protein
LFGFLLTRTETEYLPNTENNHHIEEFFLGQLGHPQKKKKKRKRKTFWAVENAGNPPW